MEVAMRWLPGFPAILACLVAAPVSAAVFAVDSTVDAVDASSRDGFCATALGLCTLRAAVMEANALPGADTIDLPAGTYELSIPGANEDAAATGDLDLLESVTLSGAGAADTIVDAGLDRVFDVPFVGAAAASEIRGVTLTDGSADFGAGLRLVGSDTGANHQLVITEATIARNTSSGDGGGIGFDSDGFPTA